ncbi:FAD-dependent thymidylate synthase, partial [Candidatus Micrarchaeota archaeon]|nr:FAD-dependent thymidylate synthase [Candidatus Micrarchaeota archaeon]
TKKAEEFYERILVGFGDDSVAELAGTHVALENISIMATKVVEDARIGLSPLEKSTRYVYFDQKKEGKYLYCREPGIMSSEFAELYEQTCDMLFDAYAELIPKMSKFFEERFPKEEGVSDRAYASTIRAKTCDSLRGLLPSSTLTNMGFFGNGRAFEYLLTKMYANDLKELNEMSSVLHGELRTVIPAFVKRTESKYGLEQQEYIKKTAEETKKVVEGLVDNDKTDFKEVVQLVDYDTDAEIKVASAIIFSQTDLSMEKSLEIAKELSRERLAGIIGAYVGERKNRRHKPYRAFENTSYSFEICTNFGAYRDLQRHRILTQERQILGTALGYDVPPEVIEAGYELEFRNTMEMAKEAHQKIAEKMKVQAQYVVPLGYRIRCYMRMNLREVYHYAELRSVQQGHPDYRLVAQEIHRLIKEKQPVLVEGMKFMDMKTYDLERLDAEKRIDKKMDELKEKYAQ